VIEMTITLTVEISNSQIKNFKGLVRGQGTVLCLDTAGMMCYTETG